MKGAEEATQLAADEVIVRGMMKWFDPVRGYGFMVPSAGDGADVLVHFSLVRELGRRTLPEGATLTCIVVARDRGRQARRITDLDLTTAVGPIRKPPPPALPIASIRRPCWPPPDRSNRRW